MRLDCLDDVVAQRRVSFFRTTRLVKRSHRFTGGVEDESLWKQRARSKMRKFVFGKFVKPSCSTEFERCLFVTNVGDGRY
jgi:hypothetical protein